MSNNQMSQQQPNGGWGFLGKMGSESQQPATAPSSGKRNNYPVSNNSQYEQPNPELNNVYHHQGKHTNTNKISGNNNSNYMVNKKSKQVSNYQGQQQYQQQYTKKQGKQQQYQQYAAKQDQGGHRNIIEKSKNLTDEQQTGGDSNVNNPKSENKQLYTNNQHNSSRPATAQSNKQNQNYQSNKKATNQQQPRQQQSEPASAQPTTTTNNNSNTTQPQTQAQQQPQQVQQPNIQTANAAMPQMLLPPDFDKKSQMEQYMYFQLQSQQILAAQAQQLADLQKQNNGKVPDATQMSAAAAQQNMLMFNNGVNGMMPMMSPMLAVPPQMPNAQQAANPMDMQAFIQQQQNMMPTATTQANMMNQPAQQQNPNDPSKKPEENKVTEGPSTDAQPVKQAARDAEVITNAAQQMINSQPHIPTSVNMNNGVNSDVDVRQRQQEQVPQHFQRQNNNAQMIPLNHGNPYGRSNMNSKANPFSRKPQASSAVSHHSSRGGHNMQHNSGLHLVTNQFQLKFHQQNIINTYSIAVKLISTTDENGYMPNQSQVERRLKDLLAKIDPQLKQVFVSYVWSGLNLFSITDLDDEEVTYKVEHYKETYVIKMNKVSEFNLEDVNFSQMDSNPQQILFLNLLIQKIMKSGSLKQVGRQPRFFRECDKMTINDPRLGRLEIWPGFKASSYIYNSGIFVVLESMNKFVRRENCLEKLHALMNQKLPINVIIANFKDQLIMTDWGNKKTYKVSSVRLDMTPQNTKFNFDGDEVSLVSYFREKYGVILDARQPLLEIGQPNKKPIYLPPQLCIIETLPDLLSRNKDLINQYKKGPVEKLRAVKEVMEEVASSSELQEWGIEAYTEPVYLDARVLPKPQLITDKQGKMRDIKDKSSFSNNILQPVSLKANQWIILYDGEDYNYANLMYEYLVKVSKKLGTSVEEPAWIELPYRSRPQDFEAEVKASVDARYYQAVVVLLPKFNYYSQVKRALDKKGIISQIVLKSNLCKSEKKDNFAYSFAEALIKQLNVKAGGDLYHITLPKLPYKHTMLVGIDVCHFGPKSIVGFCATMNGNFSKYYSSTFYQNKNKEIGDQESMRKCYYDALREYERFNNAKVEHIIIYRDGVGDAMRDQIKKAEIYTLNQLLKKEFKMAPPKITLVVVNKRINQRFFESFNQNQATVKNPPCGTIVDSNLVCSQEGETIYDFFMVSQTATQGCILPTHFFVSYDTAKMEKAALQELTYNLCYFYFNWSGGIKVPAPCQYAHKVCKYSLDINCLPLLNNNLYFL